MPSHFQRLARIMDFILSTAFGVFLAAAFALAITPGPGIAYVVARTVSGGRSEGFASTAGTAVGGLAHVLAAALGISVLIAKSAAAFAVVKYVGAAYLIYLGVRALRASTHRVSVDEVTSVGSARAFAEGIAVEVLNVKTAVFFLAFIPQFVDPAHALIPQFVFLGSICVVLNTAADVVAVVFAAKLLDRSQSKQSHSRVLNLVSGTTMLALGAYVALARSER
ncbi:MAG TPA: LysE family translocator [Steroidobacteraceae bacterium]|nr:LysE family translocator [Steroidobacteraceae bacterium]